MPAVPECGCWMAVKVVILSSPRTNQIRRHTTRTHTELQATLTKHPVKKAERGMHMQPASGLDLRPGWAASLLKIIARCSQSAMDSGRRMGGRHFRSKHRILYGPTVLHLLRKGGRLDKMRDKDMAAYRSACLH